MLLLNFFAPINKQSRTHAATVAAGDEQKERGAELRFHVTERCLRDWIVRVVLSVVALAPHLLQQRNMNSTNWFCLSSEP